jgi:WXG100 family type VII secretion target
MIDVSFEALSAESTRLEGVADSMGQRVSAARSRVEELTGSDWTGAASSAFAQDFGQWAIAAADAVTALHALVGELRATAQDFAATEQQASQTSQSLASQVPSLGIADIMGGAA